ncbi:MAG: M20/M25/M40 family metallo-hydrolase [bacterium]|nr:M20/M25/M40 family metallo-hydrolase [bacterium]
MTICLLVFLVGFCLNSPASASEPNWNKIEPELVQLLQDLIRTDTQNPPGNELAACKVLDKFFKKQSIDRAIYPVEKDRANLLARWPGDGSKKAILLSAHTDVVPVQADEWSQPPFSGNIHKGSLYGRGAIDMKSMLAIEAMTLALLKREHIKLRRDVIFLATAAEESGGSQGAGWMIEHHRDLLDAAFALDEGGRIVTRDGKPLYVAIETEEKTAYNIKLIATGSTGHASVPRADNAIYALAQALNRLEQHPTPRLLDPVTRAFFTGIAKFEPDVRISRGEIVTENQLFLSMLTNTISPTLLSGGVKTNVLPPVAEVNLNCRLLPSTDVNAFVDTLKTWVGPGPCEFKYNAREMAPLPSPQDGLGFVLIEQVCRELFPETPVLPYLSPGMSDMTRFRSAGIPSYGLLPYPLDEAEMGRIHGKDERIKVDDLMVGMKLVYRLAVLAGE